MKIRKTLVTLVLTGAASAVSLAVFAGVPNPDNDSGTFFAYKSGLAAAATKTQPALAQTGDVSSDGLYLYSGSDRGWVNRPHSFVFVAGKFEHAADCLAYNVPKPAAGVIPGATLGEHGA